MRASPWASRASDNNSTHPFAPKGSAGLLDHPHEGFLASGHGDQGHHPDSGTDGPPAVTTKLNESQGQRRVAGFDGHGPGTVNQVNANLVRCGSECGDQTCQ
jgi:hypothetical protein